jgi:putative molybdopterin biosynthesis protein
MSQDILIQDMVPFEEALERWLGELEFRGATSPARQEEVPIREAVGRVTASPVAARMPSPNYYLAGMDGVVVLASSTYGASEGSPRELKLGKEAFFIDTGRPIPKGFDAVVPIEDIRLPSLESVFISRSATPWENIRAVGEDVGFREIIIPMNHRVRPLDLGPMLAGGLSMVSVRGKPVAGIIPVGAGLVSLGKTPEVGESIEYNSHVLASLVEEMGAEAKIFDIVPEKPELLGEVLKSAVKEADLVVVIAGPSWGTFMPARVFHETGEVIVGGVNIKPGQSVCLGIIENKPVVALPGYPVSTFLTFDIFVKPVIASRLGMDLFPRHRVEARLARKIISPQGIEEFIRVKVGSVEDRTVAIPISRGAGFLMSLVKADGFIRVPADSEILESGHEVTVELLEMRERIENRILMMGTHDFCLDYLSNFLSFHFPHLELFSSNVGSSMGLASLREGFCHLAGVHMFDPESGEYNLPFIPRLLPDLPVVVMTLFHRHLGLLTKKGNPRNIKGLKDLLRDDVTFIGRDGFSGTRLVLDYLLREKSIDPAGIRGYDNEASNHMAMASAVASEKADAGVGILPAAKALGLDFIPLYPERFDIVIPQKFFNQHPIRSLIQVIRSQEFRKELSAQGGYDITDTGKVIYGM